MSSTDRNKASCRRFRFCKSKGIPHIPIAFGSQTISSVEIHGFAPLPHSRFAFIVAIVLKRATTNTYFREINKFCQVFILENVSTVC